MSFSIFPRTVYKTKSKISGPIEVKEQLGKYTLHVGGLIQSGGIIKGIWRKALNRFKIARFAGFLRNDDLRFKNVLVFGLGGGTVVQLIKARFPEAKIIGIEIDPEIIKIGKKFFSLGKIENLKIINANAINWVKRFYVLKHRNKKFDLIIVDLYVGDKFPKEVASNEFLKNLKKLLSKDGTVIFNQLKNKDGGKLKQSLTTIFPQVEALDLRTNLFLICRP